MAKNKYESYIVLFLITTVIISVFWMRTSEGFQNETVSVGPPTTVSEPNSGSSNEQISPSSQEMLSSIMNNNPDSTTPDPINTTGKVSGAVLRSKISELTKTVNDLSKIISNMK